MVSPKTRNVIPRQKDLARLARLITGKTVIMHNSKFDIRALDSIGFCLNFPGWKRREGEFQVECKSLIDTLIASHVVCSSDDHGLKELSLKYFEFSDYDEKKLKQMVTRGRNKAKKLGWNIGTNEKGKPVPAWDYWIPGQIFEGDTTAEEYAIKDVERTMLLWKVYEDLLPEMNLQLSYEREMDLLPTVFNIENKGLTINFTKLGSTIEFLKEERTTLGDTLIPYASETLGKKINLNSADDLKALFYGKLKFPVEKRTDKGNPALDKDTLIKWYNKPDVLPDHKKLIHDLLLYKTYGTCTNYIKGYYTLSHEISPVWARIFPSLNQIGADTNRFTSSNPNGQNVGKKDKLKFSKDEVVSIPKLRDMFGPYPGKIWYSIDYSQIELRVFAAVSREQSLIDVLDAGYDFHGFVASKIFDKAPEDVTDAERTIAKNVNFALIFGASPRKVNQTAGIPNAYELFAGQFPNASKFMQETIQFVKDNGFVNTIDGYRLVVPYSAPYKGVNYMVQGTAGRILKSAMRKIAKQDWFGEQIDMILQIHDELLFEVDKYSKYNSPKYIRKIMDLMEESGDEMGVNCPVSTEVITKDWGHGKELKRVTATEFIAA